MTIQAGLWTGVAAALGVAVLAGVSDWRRGRRRDLDAAGWVPWRGLQVAAFFAAALLAILAVRL